MKTRLRGTRAIGGALALAVALTLFVIAPQVSPQQQQDLTSASEHAFVGLFNVYQSGGQAPDLLAKLNAALELIQAAGDDRVQGNLTGAAVLEMQARLILKEVEQGSPAAQEQALESTRNKTYAVIASVPIAVIISTVAFYYGLRVWRLYEKKKLFEMEIIGEKAED